MAVDEARGSAEEIGFRQLAGLLSQAEYVLTRRLALALQREECTVEQWRTLTLLIDGRSLAMSQIAELAMVPPPSLTRLVDRMVGDNLLYRKVDPRDRRRVLVRVAPRGQALHRRLLERLEEEQPLAALDSGQRAQLAALLGALIQGLRDPRP